MTDKEIALKTIDWMIKNLTHNNTHNSWTIKSKHD